MASVPLCTTADCLNAAVLHESFCRDCLDKCAKAALLKPGSRWRGVDGTVATVVGVDVLAHQPANNTRVRFTSDPPTHGTLPGYEHSAFVGGFRSVYTEAVRTLADPGRIIGGGGPHRAPEQAPQVVAEVAAEVVQKLGAGAKPSAHRTVNEYGDLAAGQQWAAHDSAVATITCFRVLPEAHGDDDSTFTLVQYRVGGAAEVTTPVEIFPRLYPMRVVDGKAVRAKTPSIADVCLECVTLIERAGLSADARKRLVAALWILL